MNTFYVEIGFKITDYGTTDDLDAHLDCVLDALYEDTSVSDPDYAATLTEGRAEFSLTVEADDDSHAFTSALVAMRAAIHAAEGCTPGWEAHFKKTQTLIREAELVDA
ncbi:hypothetical protein [Aeromicrobium sp. UC242_57]|uniref:hypothetical protein n=1 Tax=Aeromicrobium sp. UC242_57 TaxID=3374624 RepID=UPI0037A9A1F9